MPNMLIEQLGALDQLPAAAFLDRISDFALLVSADGQAIEYVNSHTTDLLGWSRREIEQFSPCWPNLLSHASALVLRELLVDVRQGRTAGRSIAALRLDAKTSGGLTIPLDLHSIFRGTEHTLLLARSPLSRDSAEEILRQTQARFRSIVDSLSINLVLKDTQCRRIYANRAYLELRQQTLAELVGKTDADLLPADLAAEYQADDELVLQTGEVIHKFEENVDPKGIRRWTETVKGPLRDADGNITGIQVLFWDATDRKATEAALERERHLLHTLLDYIPDSIYFKDRQSRFVRISRGMARKFNLPDPEVAIGKTDADIFTGEHADRARQDELHIMRTGEPMIANVERETWPDRSDTWSSTTKLPLYDPSGRVVGTFGISRDVTAMIEVEQQLRDARDQADRANAAKSEFLANMSHEIRTPMNGIIGMTELLSHTPLKDDQRSFVDMIEQSAQSLLRIINDILDFSKIEAGKLDLEHRAFDLHRCVSHAAKSLAARAGQKQVELILKIEPDVPSRLLGDPDRLRQVLVNLVGNAIKFTSHGEITIRVAVVHGPPTQSDYTLHFSVRDTGLGIPIGKQAAIFEAFSQADVSTTRQYGGTGLGLSISSQLVDMMGGEIWLESEVGVGSTFHFTATFSPNKQPEEADQQTNGSLRDFTVLLVDENTTSRETLQSGLRLRGLRVMTAASPADALHMYEQFAAHDALRCALIVDHNPPTTDGAALIAELVASRPEFQPGVILLTSLARPIPADFSSQYRVISIMQKPALQSEICAALHQWLASDGAPATARSAVGSSAAGSTAAGNADDPAASAASGRAGLRILLAEDGVVNRAVFIGLLERDGQHVTSVEDGRAAIEAWREFDFDAIFMDVQMPDMDGLQATELIRKEEAISGAHIPIIAITAAAMEGDQARCRAAGMDDYLSKPVDLQQMQRIIARLRAGRAESAQAGDLPGDQPVTRPAGSACRSDAPHSGLQPGALSAEESGLDLDLDSELEFDAELHVLERAPKKSSTALKINFAAPLSKLNYTCEQQYELISTLRRETIQRLEELTRAIDGNDAKLFIRAAHSLRSAAALFEADTVASIAGKVEEFARCGDIATATQQFDSLRSVTTQMLEQIDDWLSSHDAAP